MSDEIPSDPKRVPLTRCNMAIPLDSDHLAQLLSDNLASGMQHSEGISSAGDFPEWVSEPDPVAIKNLCAGINLKTPFDSVPLHCTVSDTSSNVRFVPQSTQTFCPARTDSLYPYTRVWLGSDSFGVGAGVHAKTPVLSLFSKPESTGEADVTITIPETLIGYAEYQDAKTACYFAVHADFAVPMSTVLNTQLSHALGRVMPCVTAESAGLGPVASRTRSSTLQRAEGAGIQPGPDHVLKSARGRRVAGAACRRRD